MRIGRRENGRRIFLAGVQRRPLRPLKCVAVSQNADQRGVKRDATCWATAQHVVTLTELRGGSTKKGAGPSPRRFGTHGTG